MQKSKLLRRKNLITSFKLNVCQKMFRFRKVTLAKLKIEELPPALPTSNFQELFVNKFDQKSN